MYIMIEIFYEFFIGFIQKSKVFSIKIKFIKNQPLSSVKYNNALKENIAN